MGSPQIMKSSACLARFSAALTEVILAVSFLLLASSCLPRPSRAANFSWIPLHPAIAVEELGAVPWVDSRVEVELMVAAVVVAVAAVDGVDSV